MGGGHVGGRGACRGGGADGWMDQEREKTIDRELWGGRRDPI